MAKRIAALLIALFLVLSMSMVAFAHEVPDLERENCSITISMHMGDKLIPGGTLQLFYVGAVQEEDGNYGFVPAGDFEDCGLEYGVLDEDLALKLRKLALDCEPMREEKVGKDAEVTFDGLDTGLYLVVQRKTGPEDVKANPFLIGVPSYEKSTGEYSYSVVARPKLGWDEESKPTKPTTPKPPKLPQTGQTNWPVPVLLVMGLGMMFTGWILRNGRKTDEYEA